MKCTKRGYQLIKSLEPDDREMVKVIVDPHLVLPILFKERSHLESLVDTQYSLGLIEEILALDDKINDVLAGQTNRREERCA